jgi:HEAT repeat protein
MKRFPENVNGIVVPYEKDISELKSMLKEDLPYYSVACIALAHKSNIDSLNLLAECLSNKDWCRRRMAIEALACHPMGYLQSDKLINLLNDKSRYVIKATLEAIIVHSINKARDKVLDLIKSSDEEIRKEAIACLHSIGSEVDTKQIIELFIKERSKLVRDEAAWFIRQKSDNNTWSISVGLLKESNLARHRVWACELIGIYGDKEDIQLLNQLKNDKDGHVKKAAFKTEDKLK